MVVNMFTIHTHKTNRYTFIDYEKLFVYHVEISFITMPPPYTLGIIAKPQ
jgi:hypothetical protein